MKNERGYTLVITLLMITLIFVGGIALIANSVNSAKQNKYSEANYRATQLAEMGVVYVQEKLLLLADEIDDGDTVNIEREISSIDEKSIDSEHQERKFIIKDFVIDYTPDVPYIEDGEEKTKNVIHSFTFKSVGKDSAGRTAELVAKLAVNSDSGETETDSGESEGEIVSGGDKIDIGSKDGHTAGKLKIDPPPTLQSGWFSLAGSSAYVYKGDSIFPQFGISGENSTLVVEGDATFKGSIDTEKNLLIAVYGDANFNSNISPSENTRILIAGFVNATTISLGKNSLFLANGFKTPTNVDLGEGTQFQVCSNSTFNTVSTNLNNLINICNDGIFNSNINFNSNVTMNIKNNATFNGFTLNRSQITVGNDLTINDPWSNHNKNSTIRVFGDLFLNTGLNTDSTGQTIVYGDMYVKNGRWQSLGNAQDKKVCVRGNIYVPSSWSSDDKKILTEKPDATSCESLPNGIYYNMKNLSDNKNNYFQACTESCRLDKPKDPPPDEDEDEDKDDDDSLKVIIDKVTY